VFGVDGCDEPLTVECDGLETPEELRDVALADLCVFVDPVDATLAFVKAEALDAVQTLVGIAYKGRAVAGAIGLPFHDGSPVVRALVGAGVTGLPRPSRRADAAGGGAVLTASANAKDAIVVAAEEVVGAAEKVPRTGAGNKMLAVACGAAHVTVLNRVSSLWDTCAPEAMLAALGGTVTDLCGNRIRHAAGARIGNTYGVVATSATFSAADAKHRSHAELCRDMRAACVADRALAADPVRLVPTAPGEAQATDVARDVDGDPITAKWLSSVVGGEVDSYAAPESSAHRYLMSDAVRLVLKPRPSSAAAAVPASLFYKRVVLQELEHVKLKARTAPEKIARDVTSYQVEASFLASRACARLCATGANIPRPYHVVSRPACVGDSPADSRFALLLEDYSPAAGWSQEGLLGGDALRAALASLADMHAFFWSFRGDADYAELAGAVWDRATYWVPERQAADQFDRVAPEWEKHRAHFAAALAGAGVVGCGGITLDNLGERLAAVAPAVAARVHAVGADEAHPQRTVLHGDAKAANFFFRAPADVGMIDFQWAGFGHPVVDVAYLIASSAALSQLSHDGAAEAGHVAFYTRCLHRSLVAHGKARTEAAAAALLPLAAALDFYDDAVVDLARLVFAYHWARIRASPDVLRARAHMLGSNSYNKSVPHAVWLVARTAALLAKRP
jgi:fructose-1,6-bisphosphatase/inositol monophosphatase family enzyme